MTLTEALLFGILQGLTEFLPISSTAHLHLIPWLMPTWFPNVRGPSITFDVALHTGTLLAVLGVFWRDWMELTLGAFKIRSPRLPEYVGHTKLFWFLAAASVPAAIAGALGERWIETYLLKPWWTALALIGIAMVMFAADRAARLEKKLEDTKFWDAFLIGCAQALALMPGVSRSGITISAGLFRGLDRTAAARFSFLLSTPIIAGAAAKEGWEIVRGGLTEEAQMTFLVGMISSAVVGWLTIRFLLRYLQRHSLSVFIVYRFALGTLILFAALMR